jgi:hypothetical protein
MSENTTSARRDTPASAPSAVDGGPGHGKRYTVFTCSDVNGGGHRMWALSTDSRGEAERYARSLVLNHGRPRAEIDGPSGLVYVLTGDEYPFAS